MPDETKPTQAAAKKQATLSLAPKPAEADTAQPVAAPDSPAAEPAPTVTAEQSVEATGVEMTAAEGCTVTGDGSGNAAEPIDGQPEEPAIEFVQMVRDPATYPAPHTATVHPAEVQNYALGGWERAK